MVAVLDTNYFINKKILTSSFTKGYITSLIHDELKDRVSKEIEMLYAYRIEIRDPKEGYIAFVYNEIKDKSLNLSEADISFVALSLELYEEYFNAWLGEETEKLEFLTEDNGILAALNYCGINNNFRLKEYKFRCHACFAIYDKETDFCSKCGYNTVLRVSVSYEGGKMNLHLKKDFKPKEKILKLNGNPIIYADQKEYKYLLKQKLRKEKSYAKIYESFK